MNLEKRYVEIRDFLQEHQSLYDTEALDHYPDIPEKYEGWVEQLTILGPIELILVENKQWGYQGFPKEFLDYLDRVVELTQLPQKKTKEYQIPKELLAKITEKKRHEISSFAPFLKREKSFIDIGSGAGHLSGVLLHKNKKQSLCIDQDQKIQSIGQKKFSDIEDRLTYLNKTFSENLQIETEPHDALIGLHCCGDLSVELLNFFTHHELNALYNFGCCYHKGNQFNLSQLAKENPLRYTQHALTMAAKSYKLLTVNGFDERERVKRFRYTLHFLMHDELGLEFRALGNATKEDYQGSFSDYAHKYVPETKQWGKDDLEAYFEFKRIEYKKILCLGVIRSQLSRLVELSIILDRAIYLKEKGFKVEIFEVFERRLSPRNILLKAHAKEALLP